MKKSITITKRTYEEAIASLKQTPTAWRLFQDFSAEQKEELLLFCMGERGLRVTYDTVFRKLMDPDVHPERIQHLLSAILGQKVTIKRVLPREGIRLSEDSSLVIMDIVAELEDGSLVSVEMQRAGYKFPIERADCYGSDMILRQYNDQKREIQAANAKRKEWHWKYEENSGDAEAKVFSFSMMSPSIIIVIMDHSSAQFQADHVHAVHHRYPVFDTGIPGKGLREDYYLCLDIYREHVHTEIKNERDAWMLFLGSTDLAHIQMVCDAYPEFIPLYQEIFGFTHHTGELVDMYSEALRLMSLEEEKLVIQDIYNERKQDKARIRQLEDEAKAEAKRSKAEIQQLKAENQQLRAMLEKKSNQI